jgi:hypothetical protein
VTGFEVTGRGFRHYEPIKTDYGHVVRVYESSAAKGPCLWLAVELDQGLPMEPGTAHLTLEQATAIRDALSAAIDGHWMTRDE